MRDDNIKDLYEKSFSEYKEGEIVKGKILRVLGNAVIIDLGFKSEGILPLEEFRDPKEAEEGREVLVLIERLENRQGIPVISKRRADFKLLWDKLESLYQSGEAVSGIVKKKVEGGLVVELFGMIEGFLPHSQIDLRPVSDLEEWLGKEIKAKITSLDLARSRIVLSRRALLEKEKEEIKERLFSKIKVGDIYEVTVSNLTEFGAFCDLEGFDVLLPVSEISWERVGHPGDVLSPGQKIKVKIIAFDKEAEKISVSLKQLTPHPWARIEEKYPIGSRVKGKVKTILNFGAFVELEPGVEGLIHISEMSWTKVIHHPSQILKVGDMVEAIVLDIDRENRRISLGLKQTLPDPWSVVGEKYKVGDRVSCIPKTFRDYGVYCEIEEGIEGLIRNQDLSWTKRVVSAKEVLKKGQKVEAVIMEIDKEKRKILLSLKHTKEDPLYLFSRDYKEGDILNARIIDIPAAGLVVSLPYGLEGFAPMSQLKEREKKLKEAYKIGEIREFSILKIDFDKRRILLSERWKKEKPEGGEELPVRKVKKRFRLEDHLK
ncbi:MAG: 30S ribosomal protein S1 [candidate division WOR-3 bacterium]